MIRDATEADLAAVVAIYNAAIPGRMATADVAPVTADSRRDWFAQFTPDRYPLWVVDGGGEVAGWLGFRMFYGRPAYAATAEVSVYVAPEFQGHGVGKRLLGRAVQDAPALGLKTLLYLTFAHNMPSRRLAGSLGFTGWGTLPRVAELDGVERDLLILGLRVGDEPDTQTD